MIPIGAAMLGGAAISSAAGLIGGGKANKASKKMAREQMDFQRYMTQRQHQFQVRDLKAAGLNPRLSATLGGSGSPSGAMAPVIDESKSVVDGINSAVSTLRAKEEVQNMRETNKAIQSQTTLNNATAANNLASAHNTNVSADIKSRLLPPAEAVHTISNKALSSAKGLASESRTQGFKNMLMHTPIAKGGPLRAIGGKILDSIGF